MANSLARLANQFTPLPGAPDIAVARVSIAASIPSSVGPPYVLLVRNQFKMFRANAMSHLAKVIPIESSQWDTNKKVMGKSGPLPHLNLGISITSQAASPEPALAGQGDIVPEDFLKIVRTVACRHRPLLSIHSIMEALA